MSEDLKGAHEWLDQKGAPTHSGQGRRFSLAGRMMTYFDKIGGCDVERLREFIRRNVECSHGHHRPYCVPGITPDVCERCEIVTTGVVSRSKE